MSRKIMKAIVKELHFRLIVHRKNNLILKYCFIKMKNWTIVKRNNKKKI